MANWGDNAIYKIELTTKEYVELVDAVIAAGKNRKVAQGEINEVDFICGAMAVMERLGIGCPVWPLQIMTGIKILG